MARQPFAMAISHTWIIGEGKIAKFEGKNRKLKPPTWHQPVLCCDHHQIMTGQPTYGAPHEFKGFQRLTKGNQLLINPEDPLILLMEEILPHRGCIEPCQKLETCYSTATSTGAGFYFHQQYFTNLNRQKKSLTIHYLFGNPCVTF